MSTGGPASAEGSPLGEFGRIAAYFRPLASGVPGAFGLTDDAALLDIPADRQLVVTADGMVAGIHFLPDDDPADIAHKILAVNLSDLAAKGATPLAYSLVMALPRNVGDDWVARFAAGLGQAQARFHIDLLGGDSVSTHGPLSLTINALGLVPPGCMVRRSGARPGDGLFVTGTIGDAALGLGLVLGTLVAPVTSDDRTHLLARLRRPTPRVAFAAGLRTIASAGLDVSDGLVADLRHLAQASDVTLRLRVADVPLSPPAARLIAADPTLLQTALTGGDDYEIAFTAPPGAEAAIAAAAHAAGIGVTRIGVVEAGPADIIISDADGKPLEFGVGGWRHA